MFAAFALTYWQSIIYGLFFATFEAYKITQNELE